MVRAGLEGDLPAPAGRSPPTRTAPAQTYPRPEPLSGRTRCRKLVKRINNALPRADQIDSVEGVSRKDWFVPIVADAEAGFGGPLNAFEMMKSMIEAGAAGVHFEDQLAREKKCGHLGGKVLVPTQQSSCAASPRRGSRPTCCGVPTVLVARTDADSAKLLTSDIDERDRPSAPASARPRASTTSQQRHRELHRPRRSATRPIADLIWMRDLDARPRRGAAVRGGGAEGVPGQAARLQLLARRFNWKKNLDDATIAKFQRELGAMGYKFQFVTLAGFHTLNYGMFELGARLQRARHGGLLRAAAGRVRGRGDRLHRDRATSARSAPATSTTVTNLDQRRQVLDHRAARIDRGGAVRRSGHAQGRGLRPGQRGEWSVRGGTRPRRSGPAGTGGRCLGGFASRVFSSCATAASSIGS